MSAADSPLKIIHVVRRFAFEEWGGTETVVWNTARHLSEYGIESAIYATKACSLTGDEVRDGIEIRRFKYYYPYWPLDFDARRALDKKGGNPISHSMEAALRSSRCDLIHVHSGGRVAQTAILAARRLGIPAVISFHGGRMDIPEAEMQEMLRPIRHTLRYGGLLDRLTGRRFDIAAAADAMICVGANEEQLLRERYPGRRVLFLPNGIDPERFDRKIDWSFRKHYHIPPERLLLCCIARIDYQKNQLALLQAAALLRDRGEDAGVVLIGPVSAEWYAQKMRETIKELNLEDRVLWLPGVRADDELLPAAMQSADFFVLPSCHEPFGIAVLEAWSAGVPVIAAKVGGLKYLVREGENGRFCDPADPSTIVSAIDAYRRNNDMRQIAARARIEARDNYSWKKISGRLADFYREVINGHR